MRVPAVTAILCFVPLDEPPSSFVHDRVRAAAEPPSHRRSGWLDAQRATVNPFEVTPHTERRKVLGRVVAAARPERQVMRRHIATRAHRARALE